MTKDDVALILKELRNKSGYTQDQVAAIVGKGAAQTVSSWENSKSQPDVETFLKLCELYRVDNILATFKKQPGKINEVDIPRINASLHDKIDKLDAEDCKVIEATVDATLNKSKYKAVSAPKDGTKELSLGKIG